MKNQSTLTLDQSKEEHIVSASKGKYQGMDAIFALTSLNRIGVIRITQDDVKSEVFLNMSHPTTIAKVYD